MEDLCVNIFLQKLKALKSDIVRFFLQMLKFIKSDMLRVSHILNVFNLISFRYLQILKVYNLILSDLSDPGNMV